jgi:hypothetical protein
MKIILPFSVDLPRKKGPAKTWILGLNRYRNTHHFTLNAAKIAWKENLRRAFFEGDRRAPELTLYDSPPFRFTYTAFPASNRKFDLGNVLSIVQKFTDDALIEFGIIPDDSYKVIPVVVYQFGRVDKTNPRVELVIDSLIWFDDLETTCQIAKDAGVAL